jgi:hypothetical protein
MGMEFYVAHIREIFLCARSRASSCRIRPHLRPYLSWQGTWIIDDDSINIRRIHESIQCPAMVVVWLWRMCRMLSVDIQTTNPISLRVQTSGLSMNQSGAMQLVFDGKPRCFRSFPSGESTSSIRFGAFQFGDYVAIAFSTPTHHVMRFTCYGWPHASHRLTSTSLEYVCWKWVWELKACADSLHDSMQIQVTVANGVFTRSCDLLKILEVESLAKKLCRVVSWTPVALIYCSYHK